jgi:hypothetical protein
MKNKILPLLVGVAFSLATCGNSHAMSELVSMSLVPEWPTTAQPGTVVLYELSVDRAGQGLLEVELSSSGLPDGAIATFSPSVLRFTGRKPTVQTAIMTVTCPNLTPTGTYPFTVTGAARRESITITNELVLAVRSTPVDPPVLHLDVLPEGELMLRGLGLSGQTYQIETTTNLINPVWTAMGESTADGTGKFTFFLAETMSEPMRFYRAVRPATEPGPLP